MVAMRSHSVLAVLLSDAGVERDTSSDAQASTAPATEPELSEELDGERDLGSLDLPEEYGDWKDDYADAVGISRWREL